MLCLAVRNSHGTLLIFGLYTFWIPQIVLCAVSDARQVLRPAYVIGTSALRLLLPLYLFACPSNLLRVPPQYGTAIGLVAFLSAQVMSLAALHA